MALRLRYYTPKLKLPQFALSLLFVLFGASCSKNDNPIPLVPVDFTINVGPLIELNNPGDWAYFFGGYRGIIIVRTSEFDFMAFDQACPVHPHDSCAWVRVSGPFIAYDECCGSKFLLTDGSPIAGPSRYPLLQYRTYYNPPFLRVTNNPF